MKSRLDPSEFYGWPRSNSSYRAKELLALLAPPAVRAVGLVKQGWQTEGSASFHVDQTVLVAYGKACIGMKLLPFKNKLYDPCATSKDNLLQYELKSIMEWHSKKTVHGQKLVL